MKAKLTVYCYQHPEDADAPVFIPGGDRADPGNWVIEDPWNPNLHHVVPGSPPFEFDPPRTLVSEGIDRGHIRDELMEDQREAPTHPEIGVQEGITMAQVDAIAEALAKNPGMSPGDARAMAAQKGAATSTSGASKPRRSRRIARRSIATGVSPSAGEIKTDKGGE